MPNKAAGMMGGLKRFVMALELDTQTVSAICVLPRFVRHCGNAPALNPKHGERLPDIHIDLTNVTISAF
jgi:hypothetical protein